VRNAAGEAELAHAGHEFDGDAEIARVPGKPDEILNQDDFSSA
jgi:hypothetical protein